MSEFGGSWKHQKNQTCTNSVKSLQNVEVGHHTEEEEEIVVVTWCFTPSQPLRLYQGDDDDDDDDDDEEEEEEWCRCSYKHADGTPDTRQV